MNTLNIILLTYIVVSTIFSIFVLWDDMKDDGYYKHNGLVPTIIGCIIVGIMIGPLMLPIIIAINYFKDKATVQEKTNRAYKQFNDIFTEVNSVSEEEQVARILDGGVHREWYINGERYLLEDFIVNKSENILNAIEMKKL